MRTRECSPVADAVTSARYLPPRSTRSCCPLFSLRARHGGKGNVFPSGQGPAVAASEGDSTSALTGCRRGLAPQSSARPKARRGCAEQDAFRRNDGRTRQLQREVRPASCIVPPEAAGAMNQRSILWRGRPRQGRARFTKAAARASTVDPAGPAKVFHVGFIARFRPR